MIEKQAPTDIATRPAPSGTTSLVRVEQGASIADMVNRVAGAPTLMTNIDVSTIEGKRLLLHATGTPDIDVDNLKGKAVGFKWWLIQVATVKDDKSGELQDVPRVCLFQPDGQFMAFTAWSVARWLDMFRLTMGDGPYEPHHEITVHRVAGKGNKQSFDITLA